MRTVRSLGVTTVAVILLGTLGPPVLAQDGSPSPATPGPWASAAIPPVTGEASHPRAVASDGDSLVAVGRAACEPDGACVGEAWTSTDGLNWSPVGPDAGLQVDVEDSAAVELIDVAFGPAGYVAVGQPATLWRSVDGQTWERVGADIQLRPNTTFTAIAGTPDGYLVVGASHGGKRAQAAAWTSPDATSWSEAPAARALNAGVVVDLGGGTAASGGMTAVAHGPAGFLAAGAICRPPKPSSDGTEEEAVAFVSGVLVAEAHGRRSCRAALWRSVDGVSWERQVLGKAPMIAVTDVVMGLRGLAVLGDRAIVSETGPSGPVVSVLEGDTLTRVDLEREQDVMTLWSLGTIGDRFLAVGVPMRASFGMWTSTDGLRWEPVADLPTLPQDANVLTAADVGAFADQAVIVGSAAETYEGGAEVGWSVVGSEEPYVDTSP